MRIFHRGITGTIFCLTLAGVLRAAEPAPSGDSVIRAKAGDSEIVITTTARLAGAIHSLTWGGKEFINSTDHGRQLQTAWNSDAGTDPLYGETYNPTEAGSRDDGAGDKSSTKLLKLHAEGNVLESLSQPAFWLQPGEESGGHLAVNKTVLSNHLLARHVVIGYKDLPHAIDYHVTVTLPAEEHNHHCVMEALTGYMPPEFDHFWAFDAAAGTLTALDDGPREQPLPVIFSTPSGNHAMGAFSPKPGAPRDGAGPSYGRWKFKAEQVVKWNCVYRLHDPQGLSGDYNYRIFVAVGTLEEVKSTLAALVMEFDKK